MTAACMTAWMSTKLKKDKAFKHSVGEQSHCAATAGPPLWPGEEPGREEHKATLPLTPNISTINIITTLA